MKTFVTIAAAAAALTECGGAPTAASQTTNVPATAAAAAVSPTPVPMEPLVILNQGDDAISAVDVRGIVHWTLSAATVKGLLSAASTDFIAERVAGPNVFLSRVPNGPGAGTVVVVDRSGQKIASATFTPDAFDDDVYGSPTGTEWAWSVDRSALGSTAAHHGDIMVAGIGEAPHILYSWTAPAGAYTDEVAGWTDMGIVVERVTMGGCGIGLHPDSASFLVNPVAGTLTDLFNGDSYGDASHGVRVAFAAKHGSAVTVNGTTFDEPHSVAQLVQVSPDGTMVGVQRYSFGSCAGGATPTLTTQLIDVASGNHTDVAGCGFNGWFDSAHFVCSTISSPVQALDTVQGQTAVTLGSGHFVGVIPGS